MWCVWFRPFQDSKEVEFLSVFFVDSVVWFMWYTAFLCELPLFRILFHLTPIDEGNLLNISVPCSVWVTYTVIHNYRTLLDFTVTNSMINRVLQNFSQVALDFGTLSVYEIFPTSMDALEAYCVKSRGLEKTNARRVLLHWNKRQFATNKVKSQMHKINICMLIKVN